MHFIHLLPYLIFAPLFFGIGMGPTSQEKGQYNDVAGIGNFGTSEGESDINASDSFYRAILSGDPSQISKVLGPTESAINKQGQQQKQTLSQFGNRGGGTNASAQMIGDTSRSSIDSAISSLTGNAAGALGASGSSLLATGLNAHDTAFSEANTIHQQQSAKMNDLFKSIAAVAAPAAAFIPGAGGAILSGALGGLSKQNSGGGGGGDDDDDDGGDEWSG